MQLCSSFGRTWVTLAALCAFPTLAAGQYISLKTVPVAAGDQFLIFPSQNLAMGGVSIALDDPMLDPFVNPAKGDRLRTSQFVAAPTFYSISQNSGSARTLPAGALFGSPNWFGGGVVALQQLEAGERFFGPVPLVDFGIVSPNALSERSATNKYAFGMFGTRLAGTPFAIAGSVLLADLNAVDGVEHLYALAADIDQAGDVGDFRVGLTGRFEGDRSFEVLLLHNRFSMTHDVTYLDWILVDSTTWMWEQQIREETNLDRTRTWGVHLGYQQPVGELGWRVGGTLTGNYKSHPKIPNYEIMNIPRDPGDSWAYDFGVGISKVSGSTVFGMDVIYQPAWSDTWAEAEEPVPTVGGDTIPVGGKTVENRFRFSNVAIKLGVTQFVKNATLQLGLQARSYDYHLDQWDNVEDTFRRQNEQWMEWTPSWGAQLRFVDLEIRYLGRVTTGTGRPGIGWSPVVAERAMDAGIANDIVVAPGGPLTLQNARVMTHQVSISLPIK